MKHLMSGNEATARGVYEAGIKVCSAYPGTPSTEILENLPQYGKDVYCEWAPNEKVATEVAYGASVAGSRSFCTMKMVGLNVAADPLFTAGYMGVSRMTPGVREYTDSIRCRPAVYTSAEELPLAGVQVMMASGNVSRAVAAIRGGGLALDYVSSDPGVIDITPRGVGKWSALLELCRMEGIPPENVAAAGNYLNDRDMIEHAGIGIAVGNAVPEIKALADIVLQHDCEHDAIAELVDKLLAM